MRKCAWIIDLIGRAGKRTVTFEMIKRMLGDFPSEINTESLKTLKRFSEQ